MTIKKCFRITLAVSLTLMLIATTATAMIVSFAGNADSNYILNGDFEEGNLNGYTYSYAKNNSAADDCIRVMEKNGDKKAYIPSRNNLLGGANGRFLNQKITLEPGTYRFRFDADITFTDTSDSQPFIFTAATEEEFNTSGGLERALKSIEGATASVISTAVGCNTPEIKNYGDKAGNAFAVKPVSENNHAGGRLAVDFTITQKQTIYISIGINGANASAYIDNLALEKIQIQNTGFINGDFETGDLLGYTYSYGKANPDKSDRIRVEDVNGNKAAFIPARDNLLGGANGRFLNQKLTLPVGNYRLMFDADITFTDTSDQQPFIFTVATEEQFNENGGLERALKSLNGATASVQSTAAGRNTPEIKNYGDAAGNAFAVKPISENNHVGGKLAIDFSISTEQTVYVSIGINGVNASAYIDNIQLVKFNKQSSGFVNGDFGTGDLTGYTYSYAMNNPDASDRITVVDNNGDYKAHIPARDNSLGGANGRFLNQKLTLPTGNYRLTFDADITFIATSDPQPFIFTVATEEQFNENGGLERALKSIDGAAASVISTVSGLNTPEIKNYGDAAGNAFAVKPVSENNHVGGKLAIDFNITTEQTVYVSIGINGVNASAYIDNIQLVKVNVQDTGLKNGDFETGDLTGYLSPKNNAKHNVEVLNTPKDGHNVTLSGYAAYLYGRGEVKDDVKHDSGFLTSEKIILPAGVYEWKFDLDLISGDSGTDEFIYGVYTGLLDWANRGYGSGTSIGNSDESVNNYEGHAIKGEAGKTVHKEVTVKFELAEETGVYLSLGFNTATVNTVAYVDDFILKTSTVKTSIENGDFETGDLTGYVYSYGKNNPDASDRIRVVEKDGSKKAYIPSRNNSLGGANGRFLNQKVTLNAGTYRLKFDADITFTDTSDDQPFIFTVATEEQFNENGGLERAVKCIDGAYASVLSTADSLKTPKIKSYGDKSGNAFAVRPIKAGNHARGKLSVEFTLDTKQSVYISIGINGTTASAYVDNIELESIEPEPPFTIGSELVNGDFEKGTLKGFYNYRTDWNRVEVVNELQDGQSGFTLDGYAAYLPEKISGDLRGNYLIAAVKLKAGDYAWKFDVKALATTATKNGGMVFGVYDDLGLYGRGYDGVLKPYGNATVYNNKTQIRSNADMHYNAGQIPTDIDTVNDYTATVMFSLEEEKTLYLIVGTGDGFVAYVDNMKLGSQKDYGYTKASYENKKIVYDIGFENALERPFYYDGKTGTYKNDKYYTISTEYAHSGKYSVKWDGSSKDGWKYLSFSDMSGMMCNAPKLKPNTAYQFSFWYCTKGKGDFYATGVAYQPYGETFLQESFNTATDWRKITYTFVTDSNPTGEIIRMCANYDKKAGIATYFDDIVLTEIGPDIIDVFDSGSYCEEFFNKIPNGGFEKELKNTIWDTDNINITREKLSDNSNGSAGRYCAHIKGNADLTVKIKLNSVYEYRFAFSYKSTKNNNIKVGILDDNMNELQPAFGSEFNTTGLISPSSNDGEWHRVGYSFLTPISGYVYLRISGTNADILLDDMMLFKSGLAYDTDPNGTGNIKLVDNGKTDVDTDDSVINTDFDTDNSQMIDDPIIVPSDSKGDNKTKNNGKNENRQNDNTVLIIVISVIAIVVIAAGVTLIVLFKKGKIGKKQI